MIVIPSRKRPFSVNRMHALLGKDIIYFVHESERDDYEKEGAVVDTHNIVGYFSQICNEIARRYLVNDMDWVCQCDDDLMQVSCLAGNNVKRFNDSASILTLIENGVEILFASGAGGYAWSRNPSPLQFMPHRPITLVAPMSGCFIINKSTSFADGRLQDHEDVDRTLSTLANRRFVIVDMRFYFGFGAFHQGRGGLQGIRTKETASASFELMKHKWGKYANLGKSNNSYRKKSGVSGMSIRVNRQNTTARISE